MNAIVEAAQQLPLYDIDDVLRSALWMKMRCGTATIDEKLLLLDVEQEMFEIAGALPGLYGDFDIRRAAIRDTVMPSLSSHDPGLRTLRRLANGLCYPAEHHLMIADVLHENPEVTADLIAYALSGIRLADRWNRRALVKLLPDLDTNIEALFAELDFPKRMAYIMQISRFLVERRIHLPFDDEWMIVSASWYQIAVAAERKRKAA
jgi:hypothetical protein